MLLVSASRRIHELTPDSAILRFAESLRPVKDSIADWTEVFKVNFNSKTKFMLKLLRANVARPAPVAEHDTFEDDDYMLLVKGAPDVLLKRCSFINNPAGGPPLELTSEVISRLTTVQEEWAAKGQRVLLLAKKIIPQSEIVKETVFDQPEFADHVNQELNQGLTVVGLVGIVDPPRADIPDTVRTMRGAGIRFFMVTGDFAITAVAIAEQCGIVTDASKIHHLCDLDRDTLMNDIEKHPEDGTQSLVLSGPDLMEMNDSQWEQACQYREIVFARVSKEGVYRRDDG